MIDLIKHIMSLENHFNDFKQSQVLRTLTIKEGRSRWVYHIATKKSIDADGFCND